MINRNNGYFRQTSDINNIARINFEPYSKVDLTLKSPHADSQLFGFSLSFLFVWISVLFTNLYNAKSQQKIYQVTDDQSELKFNIEIFFFYVKIQKIIKNRFLFVAVI